MNEFAGAAVEHMAYHPGCRVRDEVVCSQWCRRLDATHITLLYLLSIPASMEKLYPPINDQRTAIKASSLSDVKWALPSETISDTIDNVPAKKGSDKSWGPEVITVATYSPCSLRSDGAEMPIEQQMRSAGVAAFGMQEARDWQSFTNTLAGKWWITASAGTKAGTHGCRLCVNLEQVWATCGQAEIIPTAGNLFTLHVDSCLVIARMVTDAFSVLFAVPHAPHSANRVDKINDYWTSLTNIVGKVAEKGGRIVMLTHGNAHLFAEEGPDFEHAQHFRDALDKLLLSQNTSEK